MLMNCGWCGETVGVGINHDECVAPLRALAEAHEADARAAAILAENLLEEAALTCARAALVDRTSVRVAMNNT